MMKLSRTSLYLSTALGVLSLVGCGYDPEQLKEEYTAAEARCVPTDTLQITDEYQNKLFSEFLVNNELVIGENEYGRPDNTFNDSIDHRTLRHRSTGRQVNSRELSEMIVKLCPRQAGVLPK